MDSKKIHLVGVGGVGMAALAVLLKNRGHDVSGCDLSRSARMDRLAALGIPVVVGHAPAHVADADEVVVTPAVPRDCAELVAAEGRVRARGDVLADLVNAAPDSIAVCGSHGKTTTATFVARLLAALGEDVEWAVGGETGDFPVAGRTCHARTVTPQVLVVEADESDGTLARYAARTLVVTNCDYDHPDHFPTKADYDACFDTARRRARDVVEGESLAPLVFLEDSPAYAALAPHNRRNARCAVEVALRRGHAPDAVLDALPDVLAMLPDRRFEKISNGVYTDYAHHPAEISCAVSMARQVCPGRLRVLFQPHRHSRTKAFLADFPAALALADEIVVCPVYAAFEPPVEGGDGADLYKAIRESSAFRGRVFLARDCAEAWEHARNSFEPGDITLLLGAGDIVALAARARSGEVEPPRRMFVGQETNLWRSDLNLSVEYVKATGPAAESGAMLVAARPRLCPWMAGIPGTVGGWVKMNAGAFGHSISEVIEAVKVDGRWLPAASCGFAYRTSAIEGEIQDVRWKEIVSSDETPKDYLLRRKKFPPGTKGSVFKNPPGDFAGRILETAGAKEMCVGGAHVWQDHANVIVAGADATASDFLALARLMARRAYFRTGVRLESEVVGLAVWP